ncbi:hypothetical protein MKZ09_15625 [Paenibacillus sp. FSL R5-0908]|uniref:phage tail fiber protein n=2 Tax=Paenibacillus TaxID=44249 RepID=UPI00096C7B6C|nr:hypothetical protein [Paenibacillus odorifer]OME03211.1 hypothetical protein BSK60_33350 [Paenibacillus odorifer]
MAMQISNWLSAALLNAAFRNVAFSQPSTVYLALYTSDPTQADTGTEVSGGSYVRKAITFAVASLENGKMTVRSSTDVEFPIATADWGLVTHVGLRTALTGGNLLCSQAIIPRSALIGDKPRFYAGSTLIRFAQ